MKLFWILLAVAAALCLIVVLISYICFRIAFYAPRNKQKQTDEIDIPPGEVYEPFRESILRWSKALREMPCEEMTITSFDGLKLYGRFFEYAPGAPIELMFHGYRGSAERDLAGGVRRCRQLGRSTLLVDQRCSGKSEGNVITFGIREHRDCLSWIDFMLKRFGPEVKIILTGVSMGAATVMMAADKPLPENVIGILADCGYTSPREIMQEVIGQMGLPGKLCYPFTRLGAILFGGFDPDAGSPLESVKRSRVPIIFYHGESDDYVPCYMSRVNYEACTSRKQLVTIPGAGHGLSYPVAKERYLQTLADFFGPEASAPIQ